MADILLINGDGIGPEVITSARAVLESLVLPLTFSEAEAGFACYQKHGTSLPESTIAAAKKADAILFGAVTTPPNLPDYSSAILGLRQRLNLFANVRPVRSWPISESRDGVDMVIVRENTEGLYSGSERVEENGERAVTERIITRTASERIVRYACELARIRERKNVTLVHKANVLRETCGLFLRAARGVSQEYSDLSFNEEIVDAMAMKLIKQPQSYDVIVTTNLFGDILSDEACMLTGGIGLAASANIGEVHALFEPVHGSAPDIAGKGIANPFATLLAAALMLDHLGHEVEAIRVRAAVEEAIRTGHTTPDLGGKRSTEEVTDHIIRLLKRLEVSA